MRQSLDKLDNFILKKQLIWVTMVTVSTRKSVDILGELFLSTANGCFTFGLFSFQKIWRGSMCEGPWVMLEVQKLTTVCSLSTYKQDAETQ